MSMIVASTEMNNPTSSPENTRVLRNEILLPKSPFFCIVVCERGLRNCPESPLLTRISPATGHAPQTMPYSLSSL